MSYKIAVEMGYVGPDGPHMAYYGQKVSNISIHPRVRSGQKKVNTCARRNPNRKGYLARASKILDIRRLDHLATVNFLKNKPGHVYTEGQFVQPGSMNI